MVFQSYAIWPHMTVFDNVAFPLVHGQKKQPRKVVLLTECSMSDNVAASAPDVDFIRPCNLCPHMKRITLENIYDALIEMKHEVEIPEPVRVRAKRAIDRMLALPKPATPRAFETHRPLAQVELV